MKIKLKNIENFYIKYQFIFNILIFLIVFIILLFQQKKHLLIIELFKNVRNIINFIIISIICITIFLLTTYVDIDDEIKNKLRESIKKAIIAFIIAFFVELKLMFAPFYLIFIFAYSLHGWV